MELSCFEEAPPDMAPAYIAPDTRLLIMPQGGEPLAVRFDTKS